LRFSYSKSDNETIYLNDEQVNIEILVGYVQAKLAEQKDKSVVLRADTEVDHGVIINIMDLLRKKGIYKIIISFQFTNIPTWGIKSYYCS